VEYCGCVGFPNVGIGGRRYITDRRNNVRIRREKRNDVREDATDTQAAIGGEMPAIASCCRTACTARD
jgi:hypothetical protein